MNPIDEAIEPANGVASSLAVNILGVDDTNFCAVLDQEREFLLVALDAGSFVDSGAADEVDGIRGALSHLRQDGHDAFICTGLNRVDAKADAPPYRPLNHPVDYAAAAQAFGAHGETIVAPEEVGPAIERAISSGKPAVLDMRVDPAELAPK